MAVTLDPRLSPGAPRDTAAAAPSATDFRQFASLRRGAEDNDPAVLREVARQFESIFTRMMLESMRNASFGDPLFGSDQADMYQDMMDDQLAVQLSQGRGIGLADMLVRQLQSGAGATPSAGQASGEGESHATPEQQRAFIDRMLPQAEVAARELGVDARAIVAQAALETGWGIHRPGDAGRDSHNYFGIKAGESWRGASVGSQTREVVDGVTVQEPARFRAYGSLEENLADYVRLLRDNPRYAAALGTGSDVRAFATALQDGGYATDPGYADKLVATAQRIAQRQEIAAAAPRDVNSFKTAANPPIPGTRLNNG